MPRFTKEQLDSFDDYDNIRPSRLSEDEMRETDEEARVELDALMAMQESLTREIAAYMAKEDVGIVELTKRLKTSSRQTSHIIKGEVNDTLAILTGRCELYWQGAALCLTMQKVVKRRGKGASRS